MHSPEQMRKKNEAMRESEDHAKNSTVDGSLPPRRFMSKTEMQGEEMVKDAGKEGLHMEIER